MLATFFGARHIRFSEIRDYSQAPARCWVRDITIETERNGNVEYNVISMHADTEDGLLLPHELEERVTLAERAAHDDKAEAALVVNS